MSIDPARAADTGPDDPLAPLQQPVPPTNRLVSLSTEAKASLSSGSAVLGGGQQPPPSVHDPKPVQRSESIGRIAMDTLRDAASPTRVIGRGGSTRELLGSGSAGSDSATGIPSPDITASRARRGSLPTPSTAPSRGRKARSQSPVRRTRDKSTRSLSPPAHGSRPARSRGATGGASRERKGAASVQKKKKIRYRAKTLPRNYLSGGTRATTRGVANLGKHGVRLNKEKARQLDDAFEEYIRAPPRRRSVSRSAGPVATGGAPRNMDEAITQVRDDIRRSSVSRGDEYDSRDEKTQTSMLTSDPGPLNRPEAIEMKSLAKSMPAVPTITDTQRGERPARGATHADSGSLEEKVEIEDTTAHTSAQVGSASPSERRGPGGRVAEDPDSKTKLFARGDDTKVGMLSDPESAGPGSDVRNTAFPPRPAGLAHRWLTQRDDRDIVAIYKHLTDLDFFTHYFSKQMILTSSEEHLAFCRHVQYATYTADEIIFRQGDVERRFYIVLTGSVDIVITDMFTGKSRRVATLGKQQHFGEVAIKSNNGVRTATARATEPTEVLLLDWAGFRAVYETDHSADADSDFDEPSDEESLLPITRFCRYHRDGRPKSMEERIELAVSYIRDAQKSVAVKRHRFNPKYVIQIDRVLKSNTFHKMYMFVVFLHLSLAFLEAPSARAAQTDKWRTRALRLLGIEWLIIIFFTCHYTAEWYSLGRRFFSKRLYWTWTLAMSVFWLDLLIASGSRSSFFRFSRPVRPFMLVLKFPLLRVAYTISVRTLGSLMHMWIILILMFLFYACMGMYLFKHQRDIYNEEAYLSGQGYPDCDGPCPPLESWVFTSFSSYGRALITLFVLLTTENFPEVAHPAYMTDHMYQIYFITFWMLGEAFLLQLLLALVFNVYKELMEDFMLKRLWHERFALHCAFECLDIHRTGHVTLHVFRHVIKAFRPEFDQVQIEAFFRLMDQDNNGLVEEREFWNFLENLNIDIGVQADDEVAAAKATVSAALDAKGVSADASQRSPAVSSSQTRKRGSTYTGFQKKKFESDPWLAVPFISGVKSVRVKAFFTGRWHENLVNSLILADLVVLLIVGVEPSTGSVTNPLQILMWCFFAIDMFLLILILGIRSVLKQKWYQFDLAIDLITLYGLVQFSNDRPLGFLRFAGMLRSLRLGHLFEVWGKRREKEAVRARKEAIVRERYKRNHEADVSAAAEDGQTLEQQEEIRVASEDAMEAELDELSAEARRRELTVLDTMLKMVPWFLFMVMVMLCVLMYAYALIGIELWPSKQSACSGAGWIGYDPKARFCDFPAALASLLQMVTTSNWHEMMYPAMDLSGDGAAIYFISFYFFASIIMFNIMTAVFIEIFQTVKMDSEILEDDEGVALHDILEQNERNGAGAFGYEGDSKSDDETDTPHSQGDPDAATGGDMDIKNRHRRGLSTGSSRVFIRRKVKDVMNHGLRRAFGNKNMSEDEMNLHRMGSFKGEKGDSSWWRKAHNVGSPSSRSGAHASTWNLHGTASGQSPAFSRFATQQNIHSSESGSPGGHFRAGSSRVSPTPSRTKSVRSMYGRQRGQSGLLKRPALTRTSLSSGSVGGSIGGARSKNTAGPRPVGTESTQSAGTTGPRKSLKGFAIAEEPVLDVSSGPPDDDVKVV